VAQHADRPATLEALLKLWARMARHLRASRAAHGDLQHGNVLLVPDAGGKSLALKLVDYDGMFVPALAGSPSGEVGHPSYQHPQRQREGAYSLEVDRFPVLLVATALAALKVKGRALWEKYDNADNLLFTQEDLEAPNKSRLFYELLKLDDSAARTLAEALAEAARKPLDETPLLADLLAGGMPAPTAPAEGPAVSPHAEVAGVVDATAQAAGGLADDDFQAERRRRNAAALWIAGGAGAAVALLVLIVAVIVLAGGSGGNDSGKVQAVGLVGGMGASKRGPALPREDGAGAPRRELASHREGSTADSGKGMPPARGSGGGDSRKGEAPGPGDGSADPKPPKPPQDKLTNSLGMKFVTVPAGTFWMSKDGKNAQRQVRVGNEFQMAVHPVTQAQWRSVMGTDPSHFSRGGAGKDSVKDIPDEELNRFPVENVSWNDAQDFLKRLNEKEKDGGWRYRLPTEAKWEYACRGGATDKADCGYDYYFDRPTNDLDSTQANFMGDHPGGNAAKGPNLGRPCVVGAYRPNRLGLHDMHGNVRQWCEAGADGGGRPSPAIRGGSWHSGSADCRAASRWIGAAPEEHIDDRGFRVVRVPVGKEDE
jgi:formylglycine-generating enzyme required for sulfatase activity